MRVYSHTQTPAITVTTDISTQSANVTYELINKFLLGNYDLGFLFWTPSLTMQSCYKEIASGIVLVRDPQHLLGRQHSPYMWNMSLREDDAELRVNIT